jgi:hypothetical protein
LNCPISGSAMLPRGAVAIEGDADGVAMRLVVLVSKS